MDLISRLNTATLTAQNEDDLPDFLAERVYAIAEELTDRPIFRAEIEELIEQLSLYDTYGQTGYIGMGVNNYILEGTIVRIEKILFNCGSGAKD
jgi:stress response protein YsnF